MDLFPPGNLFSPQWRLLHFYVVLHGAFSAILEGRVGGEGYEKKMSTFSSSFFTESFHISFILRKLLGKNV
jgi:hypothetical protein